MTAPRYDAAFYDRAEQSQIAARTIVPIVRSFARIESVLDVGCARGTWLAAWAASGCADYMGVDGNTVQRDKLLIEGTRFVTADLSSSFSLGRRFDFAQCLEVAEHLPRSRSASLVSDLVNHADMVLFSAAPPGQGGEFHINEQPYDFWRVLFAAHDYLAFDCLRPALRDMSTIPFWYRYNPVLYVKSQATGKLSPEASGHQLAPGVTIPDVAPLPFRARKALVRLMPAPLINMLARLNARLTQ